MLRGCSCPRIPSARNPPRRGLGSDLPADVLAFTIPACPSPEPKTPWPHAPTHQLAANGTFFVMWFNFRETRLTYAKSYFARLNYTHRNPVKHGLVPVANQYPWCSAAWFERTASPAQVKTIYRLKTDKLQVPDDFPPLPEW